MDFLVITAFYDGGDRYRRRNLVATLANSMKMFPEARICVAEQNPSGWFDILGMDPGRITHVTRQFDGGFCKTALLNAAVEAVPDPEIIVMVDGDVFLTPGVVDCIRNKWDRGSLVYPFSDTMYLNEVDTRLIVGGKELLPGEKYHGVNIERQTGLCNVVTRENWIKVGGYDEAFVKWGAEDDAFLVKCARIVGPIYRNADPGCVAYHLFHPRVNTMGYMLGDEGYFMNRLREACIRCMSDDDLKLYVSGKVSLDALVEIYGGRGELHPDTVCVQGEEVKDAVHT